MALTKDQKHILIQMRNEGMGYVAISKELSVTRDQVRGFCKTETAKILGLKPDIRAVRKSKKTICKLCEKEFDYKSSKSTTYCSVDCRKRSAEIKRVKNVKSKAEVCKGCGKSYVKMNGMQEYCGKKCRVLNCVCELCSAEYTAKRSDPIDNRKFCSRKCRDKAYLIKHEEYYMRFSDIHRGKIVPVTLYEGSNNDMTAWCISCQSRTTRKAAQFIDKNRVRGCANCAKGSSVGELKIKRWLDSNGMRYAEQHSFDLLVDKAPLRYDFAIMNEQDEIVMLIEFDGRQHYEAVESFGGKKEFERQCKSDQLKNEFAKENDIELVRISYKDKDRVEVILESTFRIPPA